MTNSRIAPSEVETMVFPASLYIVATRKTGYVSIYEKGSVCGLDKGRFTLIDMFPQTTGIWLKIHRYVPIWRRQSARIEPC
jgi:hypothetical protein